MTDALPYDAAGARRDCDITLYVACYNEQDNIVPTLNTVAEASAEAGCTYEIVLIDDASRDRSVPVIKDYMRAHPEIPIALVINQKNQGIGHNFVEAALLGRGRYYRMVCGDNVESHENFVKLFRQLGSADIILSYSGNPEVRTWFRRIVSSAYTTLVNLISGYRIHYYNNLPIFIRAQVARWHPNSHGFGFQADLVTRLLDMGATYVEVQTMSRERSSGRTSAFKLRNVCSVSHSLLEILIRRVARGLYPNLSRELHSGPQVIRTADLMSDVGSSDSAPSLTPAATEAN